MRKKRLKQSALCATAIIGGLLFSACQDHTTEEISVDETTPNTKTIVKDDFKDQISTKLAKNLASGLVNIETRNFLKQKTIQQFDGDYNFLIENSKNDQITTNSNGRTTTLTFGEILAGSNSGARESDDFLRSINDLYPLMQVAIPELEVGDAKTWDTETTPLLVAFIPSNYDESNENTIISAYDFEGNHYELKSNEEPDQLVVVISENERLIAIPKSEDTPGGSRTNGTKRIGTCPILMDPYHESETHLYYFKEDVYPILNGCAGGGGGGGGTGGSGSGSSDKCDREKNSDKKDHLLQAKFKDKGALRQVENWLSGKPEVTLYLSRGVYQANGSHTTQTLMYTIGKEGWFTRTGVLRKLKITWKIIEADLFRWDPSRFGDEMVYSWIEEDDPIFEGGASWNANLDLTFLNTSIGNVDFSGTASFSIGGQDDRMDQSFVEYCDNTDGNGTLYRGTAMEFYVKQ
ncbi:MAG: hypothetical protein AAGA66_16365 [Bacteroidota bacterium]